MVNRRAFFEIFFYNRETRSREMMEAAEGVWRAYMKKYGLGLDAGTDGQPTYDEVKEITYLANAAIEMVEKQMAEAAAEEERQKRMQKEAWDLGLSVEQYMGKMKAQAAAEEQKAAEEKAAAEVPEEVPEQTPEAAVETAAEEPVTEAAEEPAVEEVPLPEVPAAKKAAAEVQLPAEPAVRTETPGCDMSLWIDQLIRWCRNKGMQCITSTDDGDCYLHVYLPHKKAVHTVGAWCFRANMGGAELAAEITRLYAYCEGFAACHQQFVK